MSVTRVAARHSSIFITDTFSNEWGAAILEMETKDREKSILFPSIYVTVMPIVYYLAGPFPFVDDTKSTRRISPSV